MTDLDAWLADLRATALIGSGRRDPGDPPAVVGVARPGVDASREERLLDGAALADVLGRAGARLPAAAPLIDPAAAETRAVVSPAAARLLLLLLTQPPVSKVARDDLLVQWLGHADAAEQRVPPLLLPPLLTHAVEHREVAVALGGTPGERGRWLAGLNPEWSSLAVRPAIAAAVPDTAETGPADDWTATWPQLPTAEAVAVFERARDARPYAARALLQEQWDSLPARTRAECVRRLTVAVTSADEPLLERALDDRSKTVRESAYAVLDLLPTSARGQRMAARLRDLLRTHGAVRRSLEVDVPDDPDAAGERDGLVRRSGDGVQPRTRWLESIIRGAPLSVWTDVTGRSATATLRMLNDQSALNALCATVLARADAGWASALLASGVDRPGIVALLPDDERRSVLTARLGAKTVPHEVRELLAREPRPWDDGLARAVLRALTRSTTGEPFAYTVGPLLPTALPTSLGKEIEQAVNRLPPGSRARRALSDTLQTHAFRNSLSEAFR
ncbi:DUF5691 domain-containing protein [Luteipulveratus flavus]|uniref:DUF5691 domain-containing protein n=1 Tax=Luteipulveratus flavus TaxID=3031728 RepID=A0ABT6C9Y7_9MICO|nr:DUF5691 domain-containing protein [Luteipulveratus sp. YIM 133296]MDF8264864.1 DUF5691 domain-containing protein [Luteipulveratus sp. YIM 133296]